MIFFFSFVRAVLSKGIKDLRKGRLRFIKICYLVIKVFQYYEVYDPSFLYNRDTRTDKYFNILAMSQVALFYILDHYIALL